MKHHHPFCLFSGTHNTNSQSQQQQCGQHQHIRLHKAPDLVLWKEEEDIKIRRTCLPSIPVLDHGFQEIKMLFYSETHRFFFWGEANSTASKTPCAGSCTVAEPFWGDPLVFGSCSVVPLRFVLCFGLDLTPWFMDLPMLKADNGMLLISSFQGHHICCLLFILCNFGLTMLCCLLLSLQSFSIWYDGWLTQMTWIPSISPI